MRLALPIMGVLAIAACDPGTVAKTFESERKLAIVELPGIGPPEISGAVLVRVDQMGEITVDGHTTELSDLAEKLAALAGASADERLIVQAHPGTTNAFILVVREAAQAAGFENISISLDFEG